MSVVWDVEPDQLFEEAIRGYISDLHRGIYLICQRYAVEIEAWMKAERVWTDRTGNARQTLHSEVTSVVNEYVELIMAHGVEYGINLELDNGGRFAIVGPALDRFTPKIWADVRSLIE